MNVVIYRKNAEGPINYNPAEYSRKPTAKQIKNANDAVAEKVRVKRDDLLAFFQSGSFAKLPVVNVRNRADRITTHKSDGWIIPESNLGRVAAKLDNGSAKDHDSAAQSVLLWIKQNCGHVVNPDHVSVLVQP